MNIFGFFLFACLVVFPFHIQSEEIQNAAGIVDGLTKALGALGGQLQTHQCGSPLGDGEISECNFSNTPIPSCNPISNTTINIGEIQEQVGGVLNYGITEACECCQNPSKCAIGLPGGVEKFLEGAGILGGLVGSVGGVSKICKDVKILQSALAGLNAFAGIKCQSRGRNCERKHRNCITELGKLINKIDTNIRNCEKIYEGCMEASVVTGATTCQPVLVTKNKLSTFKSQLESLNLKQKLEGGAGVQGRNNCRFASQAGKAQLMQGAAFGAAAVVSHLCDKSTRGSGDQQNACLTEGSAEYDDPRCQCERGEQPEGVDCCIYDSLSPGCRANNGPCSVDPSSTECLCSQPGTQNLPQCGGGDDIPTGDEPIPLDEDPLDIGTPDDLPSSDFEFSKNAGAGDGNPFGGLPEVPPNLKAKSAFSPKNPKSTRVSGGGTPSVGGGGLPSGGGGLGGEGEGSEEEEESPYANLLDGLSGKQNQNGAGGMGGFNPGGGAGNNPFDLKKFLPKGKNRKPSSKNKKTGDSSSTTLGESIFQRASRVTRVYCNKNQVECTPASK